VIRPSGAIPVYLYGEPVDMRKSIDGLAALVEQDMALSPFEDALFVFCNRSRDKLKILCWERNGFVLWYKRLEQHRFIWPGDALDDSLSTRQLNRLLDGYDIRPPIRHPALHYTCTT